MFKIGKSGVEVVKPKKEYTVYVKKVIPRLIIHEMEHIHNGSADRAKSMNCFSGFLYNLIYDFKSGWKEITYWPKIN